MVEREIEVPPGAATENVPEMVESCLVNAGLRITMRDTLASFPGCVHWHTKRGKQRGVLEITWWPAKRRLWFSVHGNRGAPWINEMLRPLSGAIERELAG